MSSVQGKSPRNGRESWNTRSSGFPHARKVAAIPVDRVTRASHGGRAFSGELLESLALDLAPDSRAEGLQPISREAIASKPQFLWHLSHERLRINRCRTPLSLVLFRIGDSGLANHPGCVRQFLELLLESKRTTDVLGYLGSNLVGVLLVATDRPGADRFAQKVASTASDLGVSSSIHAYPEDAIGGQSLPPELGEVSNPITADLEQPRESRRYGYPGKRLLDLVGSIALMALLSPVFVLTALAIKLTSRGPVIFKQTRIGAAGRPFAFYKFRSMRCGSDDRIHKDYVTNLISGRVDAINQGDADRPVYKMKADPRITPVGRFIRKTSIDELPQLFNVLKGDMSLVGPRPPLPYEVEKYQSWHLMRLLTTMPGLTGLWQVHGRSRTTFDEMVRLDLRYARECSLGVDLKILAKTVKVVLSCEGAT